MSAVVLASGVLHKKPEQKTAKSGKQYVAATLRVREADATYQYWRLTTFDDQAQAELLRLDEGDNVSVQGLLRAEIYKPETGEPRLSMNVIVDQALPARPKPRPRDTAPRKFTPNQRKDGGYKKPYKPSGTFSPHPELNDEVPW